MVVTCSRILAVCGKGDGRLLSRGARYQSDACAESTDCVRSIRKAASLLRAPYVGIIANVDAELLLRERRTYEDGSFVEVVVWRLPPTDLERPHGLKYRLVYVRDGRRVVGYDNERGKSDHRHFRNTEARYAFRSLEGLLNDFFRDVDACRKEAT